MKTRWARVARGDACLWSPVFGALGVLLGAVLGPAGSARAGDQPKPGSARKPGASLSKPVSAIPQAALIDRAIADGWDKAGVKPAKPATDEEFLRRAYLDLLGRIPNVQEARAFLTTRESGKREKL